MEEQRKTVQDLENLIARCLDESEQAGDITTASKLETTENGPGLISQKVIVNSDNVVRHISMTIIGELHELEVVRKMAPWFRQFRSIEKDLNYIEMRQSAATSLQALRIELPTTKTAENG